MPDFDTRRPQEPERPNRMHMFGVASRLRTPVQALLRNRKKMRRRLGLALSVLSLVVLAEVLTAWAVETHIEQVDQKLDWAVETPAEQLDNEIQLEPTPPYDDVTEEFYENLDGDTELSCLSAVVDYCYIVFTEPTSAEKLASITKEVLADWLDWLGSSGLNGSRWISVEFSTEDVGGFPGDYIGTSYCFESKDEAVSTLSKDLGKADLLGTMDHCYIAVYIGTNPSAFP